MLNRTLPKGIYRQGTRYVAQGRADGRQHFLGGFDTVEKASAALAVFRAQNSKPGEVPRATRVLSYPKGYEEAEFQQTLRRWLKAYYPRDFSS